MNYFDVLYGPCLTKADASCIERLQKSLIFIYGIRKYFPFTHKLISAGWLSMAYRRKFYAICLYFLVIVFKFSPYLYYKITFRINVHSFKTRLRGSLPPNHHTALFSSSFSYNIYILFNNVPGYVRVRCTFKI